MAELSKQDIWEVARELMRRGFMLEFNRLALQYAEEEDRQRKLFRQKNPDVDSIHYLKEIRAGITAPNPYDGIKIPNVLDNTAYNDELGLEPRTDKIFSNNIVSWRFARADDAEKREIESVFQNLVDRMNDEIGSKFIIGGVETVHDYLVAVWGEQIALNLPFSTYQGGQPSSHYLEAKLAFNDARDKLVITGFGYNSTDSIRHALRLHEQKRAYEDRKLTVA